MPPVAATGGATRSRHMNEAVKDGTLEVLDGKPVIFYDGYWIRYYAPPENSLPVTSLSASVVQLRPTMLLPKSVVTCGP